MILHETQPLAVASKVDGRQGFEVKGLHGVVP